MNNQEVMVTIVTLKESMKAVVEGCELLLETDKVTFERINNIINLINKIDERLTHLESKVATMTATHIVCDNLHFEDK